MANVRKNRPNLKQGEGGGAATGSSGNHLDATGREGGARRGSSGSKFDQGEGGAKPRGDSGSHLEVGPNVPGSNRDPHRGGHSRQGYDHANPTAGKSKSGSKFKQHPSNRG